jgi:urease subunit gamma/beta
VHLTPREHERLLLAAAADLARRRLARGAPLGATEAVALVCDEICELAWDGVPLDEVIARARAVIPPAALLPGVAGLVPVIEVEALFPWGSTLVHVEAPFAQEQGPVGEVPGRGQEEAEAERVRLAPGTARSPDGGPGGPVAAGAPAGDAGPVVAGVLHGPGAVLPAAGVIELAAGAVRRTVLLRNTGPRDVWISSHFPLGQVNPAVRLRWAGEAESAPVPDDAPDPGTAVGGGTNARPRAPWHLDLPAGDALLLRAGEERAVTVILGPG